MGITVFVADQDRTFADALALRIAAKSDLPGEAANRLCEEPSARDLPA